MAAPTTEYEALIRDVPDFPKPGIIFKDIMPMLANGPAFKAVVDELADTTRDWKPDLVLGAEARGFMFGAPLAYALGAGFVAARKPGKLPYTTVSAKYALEYGFDALEVHIDAIKPGQRVLICDDLLATGGTCKAKIELVERLEGVVAGLAFAIELDFLNGRDKLAGYDMVSLIHY
jgi:adenine phosphoribosyltransferase